MHTAPEALRPSPLAMRAAAVVATVAVTALVLRLGLTVFAPDPEAGDPGLPTRLVQFVSYFTIQSNVAVALISLAVVRGRDLSTPWMRALRLAALVGITVTGVVYVLLLAGIPQERSTLSSIANLLLHYVQPILATVCWLAFGPWQGLRASDLGRLMVWPVAWFAWTLLHGAISGWYPYDFIDVSEHGYGGAFVMFLKIVVFALILGSLFVAWDRWRRGRAAQPV